MILKEGGCFCGLIHFEMELTKNTETINPRECNCDFCQKHGAAYISDKEGILRLSICDTNNIIKYRQGDKLVDFIICHICGVLVAVCYKEDTKLFAAINFRAVNKNTAFAENKLVSPETLSANEKVIRWKEIWFQNVQILTD